MVYFCVITVLYSAAEVIHELVKEQFCPQNCASSAATTAAWTVSSNNCPAHAPIFYLRYSHDTTPHPKECCLIHDVAGMDKDHIRSFPISCQFGRYLPLPSWVLHPCKVSSNKRVSVSSCILLHHNVHFITLWVPSCSLWSLWR